MKIIANGGFRTFAAAEETVRGHGIAGTMIGVALIDNPALSDVTPDSTGRPGILYTFGDAEFLFLKRISLFKEK